MFSIRTCILLIAAISIGVLSFWNALEHLKFWSASNGSSEFHTEFKLQYMFYHDLTNISKAPSFHAVSRSKAYEVSEEGQYTPLSKMLIRSRDLTISHPDSNTTLDRTPLVWSMRTVSGPDTTDRDTVINMAKMTSNAYILGPDQPDWLNSSMGFNHSESFGWLGDGLRGHVFADEANNTVIVAFKGTSIDPRDKWRGNDRVNDNILFSCCCAAQRNDPYPYAPVCNCRQDVFKCNATCIKEELLHQERYYPTALAVMRNISIIYPNANIWATGHSMGGAMASLMGMTLHIPAVTYEAPPEKLPAERLGLAIPPHSGASHFGNTGDPIFMGACNGVTATCSLAGYAFESQCFTGKRCVYDTVGDKGWRMNIANHRINTVIKDVLEVYEAVPTCEADDECIDCFNWHYDKP